MAGKAGIAYVEIKFNPGDLARMQAEARTNGALIADEMSQSADKNGGFFRKFVSGFEAIGNQVRKTADYFGKFVSESSFANGALAPLGQTLSGLAPLLGLVTTGAAAFGAALLVLPALIAAVTFVAVALLDTLTTLLAVVVSLVGPLTVLGGLLGGLGAAFFLAGQRALKGGGVFKDFGAKVDKLKGQFHDLIYTLAQRFLPLFNRLADAASIVLRYFNQLAHMTLNQAFHSLATKGVALLSQGLYGIANILKKPFRLAIQIAFGSGGSNMNSHIATWWNSLSNYLFGYTTQHPVLHGGHWLLADKDVKGALDPIMKFLGNQKFVDQGVRWGNEIIDGLKNNPNFMRSVGTIANHAGHIAGEAFTAALKYELQKLFSHGAIDHYFGSLITRLVHAAGRLGFEFEHMLQHAASTAAGFIQRIIGQAFDWVKNKASAILHAIPGLASNAASSAGNAIKNAIGGAFDWVKRKATSIWNEIVKVVEHPLSVHINWPSPPSWLSSLVPGGGALDLGKKLLGRASGGPVAAGVPYIVGEHRPELFVPEQNGTIIPKIGGGSVGGGDIYLTLDLGEGITQRFKIENKKTARAMTAGRKWATA